MTVGELRKELASIDDDVMIVGVFIDREAEVVIQGDMIEFVVGIEHSTDSVIMGVSAFVDDILDRWGHLSIHGLLRLGIGDWDIRTERIDAGQVEYDGEDYFIGIERDFEGRSAVIYHDIPLDEESIVHELLHIVFPQVDDESYEEYENFIDRLTKDTILLYELG
jgi:hypothetical protein